MGIDDVRALLKARIAEEGSAKEWGRVHGISQAYISDVLRGAREPGKKVLDALQLVHHADYRPANPDVMRAARAT